jgi:hypothetical protein
VAGRGAARGEEGWVAGGWDWGACFAYSGDILGVEGICGCEVYSHISADHTCATSRFLSIFEVTKKMCNLKRSIGFSNMNYIYPIFIYIYIYSYIMGMKLFVYLLKVFLFHHVDLENLQSLKVYPALFFIFSFSGKVTLKFTIQSFRNFLPKVDQSLIIFQIRAHDKHPGLVEHRVTDRPLPIDHHIDIPQQIFHKCQHANLNWSVSYLRPTNVIPRIVW